MNILRTLQDFFAGLQQQLKKWTPEILTEREKDISLALDKQLHEEINYFLRTHFQFPILSEEAQNPLDFQHYEEYVWIVDPLDGSMNYSREIPISCVSIALWRTRQPLIGVIWDFNRGDLYTGVTQSSELAGEAGAWLNGQPISVSDIQQKQHGILCTGFPSWRDYGTESLLNFVMLVQDWKKIRMIGSAALSLAWVASGKADAYIEEDIRIWDVAAGLALVQAAGGNVYCVPGERMNFVIASATNGCVLIDAQTCLQT